MSEVLKISNSWQLWIICGVLVVLEIVQAVLFIRLSRKEANAIGYEQKRLSKAIRSGMITSVGPALGGVVAMISMMAVIGGPITWQRLSIIGAAQTELTVANVGATVMGTELGAESFGISALTLVFLLMAINGCGWLLMTTICTGSMETVRKKLSGGDAKWLALLSAGATLGLFSNFTIQRLIVGKGAAAAVIVSFAVQYIIDHYISSKVKWIKSYALAIALILGMAAGYIVEPV